MTLKRSKEHHVIKNMFLCFLCPFPCSLLFYCRVNDVLLLCFEYVPLGLSQPFLFKGKGKMDEARETCNQGLSPRLFKKISHALSCLSLCEVPAWEQKLSLASLLPAIPCIYTEVNPQWARRQRQFSLPPSLTLRQAGDLPLIHSPAGREFFVLLWSKQ